MVRLVRENETVVATTPRITVPDALVEVEGPEYARAEDPRLHAYWILRIGFAVAPIIAGLDKFAHLLVDWDRYLAPWAVNLFGGAHPFMDVVGVIEVVAGIGVAIMPRVFGYVVSAWLMGIVINLVTYPGYYDIALRDFGLALGALALARLGAVYDKRRV